MGTTKPRLAFTLAVLVGINTMNFFDRQVLSAVQEKIKQAWGLSDFALGALGTAFILLYAVVGLPLGRMADVWVRKFILAVGCGLWSLLTFGSGFAWDFWSLFVMRLGVGVGEASCAPSGNSLIGDLVPPERRARALAVFMLGLPIGLALSSFLSGTIAQYYDSWRAPLFFAGVPGILLAVAALFIVEPVRGGAEHHAPAEASGENLSFGASIRRVFSLPTMWWIIASGALLNFNMYALGSFLASMLIRFHHASLSRAGQLTGLIQGLGALGIFAAGWLGDRAYRRGVSGRLHVAWVGMALAIPCVMMSQAATRGEIWLCTAWMIPGYGLLYFYYGTVYATIQDIIEPTLRGTAMAVYFFGQYMFGAALGPVGTGLISDYFAGHEALAAGRPTPSAEDIAVGLHKAMYVVPLLDVVLVLVLVAAALTVKKDYLRLRDRLRAAAATSEGIQSAAAVTGVTDRPA